MTMTHPTEETLNDYIERELSPAEHVRIATHLDTCPDCALVVADIQQLVRDAAALGPMEPPPHVWERVKSLVDSQQSQVDSRESAVQSQKPKAQGLWPRYAWALATAALVVMAFFTGRYAQQREQPRAAQPSAAAATPITNGDAAAVRERVLAAAVGDHLERSQMMLVELAHAETRDELDISAERQLADDLVASNRLYRQSAQQMGQDDVAGLLDELERVLVEVARGPSTVSMRQLADIQQRIESQGILFKVKVIGSEIRQQPVS
jgi:hypothetical protein